MPVNAFAQTFALASRRRSSSPGRSWRGYCSGRWRIQLSRAASLRRIWPGCGTSRTIRAPGSCPWQRSGIHRSWSGCKTHALDRQPCAGTAFPQRRAQCGIPHRPPGHVPRFHTHCIPAAWCGRMSRRTPTSLYNPSHRLPRPAPERLAAPWRRMAEPSQTISTRAPGKRSVLILQ